MNNVDCRLWGTCWGDPDNPARLVVKWNGQQVFDGTVATAHNDSNNGQTYQHGVLCTWTADNIGAGLVPVEITVHNGHATINNILLNKIVAGKYVTFKPDADIGNIYNFEPPKAGVNVMLYTDQEFLETYGFPRDTPPAYVDYVDALAEDTWVDGNFNWRPKNGVYTDGKLNAKRNGAPLPAPTTLVTEEEARAAFKQRGLYPGLIDILIAKGAHLAVGEYNRWISDGDTLSFDYLIEWEV